MANCDDSASFKPELAKKKKKKTAMIIHHCDECEKHMSIKNNFMAFEYGQIPYDQRFIAIGNNLVYSIVLHEGVKCPYP